MKKNFLEMCGKIDSNKRKDMFTEDSNKFITRRDNTSFNMTGKKNITINYYQQR